MNFSAGIAINTLKSWRQSQNEMKHIVAKDAETIILKGLWVKRKKLRQKQKFLII
jgi:lysozyme family protein